MSKALSSVEREIVIQYLSEEKPELIIKAINAISQEEDFAVFKPLRVTANSYTVQNDVILINRTTQSRILADKAQISVSFYFKGRALYFESEFQHSKNLFLIPVGQNLFKLIETGNGIYENIECTVHPLSLANGENKTFSTRFFPNDGFILFSGENEKEMIKKFFAFDFAPEMPQIQNRILPPVLLHICERFIIGGALNQFVKFEKNENYSIEIQIPQAFSSRTIKSQILCSEEYTDTEIPYRRAWKFEFTNLKEEDRRFLYEKLHGKKFDE